MEETCISTEILVQPLNAFDNCVHRIARISPLQEIRIRDLSLGTKFPRINAVRVENVEMSEDKNVFEVRSECNCGKTSVLDLVSYTLMLPLRFLECCGANQTIKRSSALM